MGMGNGIWMIMAWIAITGLSIWLLASLFPRTGNISNDGQTDNALSFLRRRYASGELSKEEFETLRRHLEQS